MAIDNSILTQTWEGQPKSTIEDGIKALLTAMLALLENPEIADNSIGRDQLTQALRDAIDAIANKVPNNRKVNGKALSSDVIIGAGDINVGNQTLAALLSDMASDIEEAAQSGDTPDDEMSSTSEKPVQNKVIKAYVDAISQRIDTLIGSGNVQGAIDTFNEVVAFLNGINSSETLAAKLALKANDNAVVKSVSVNGTAQTKDGNGNVNIQVQAGEQVSVIEPADHNGTFIIRVGSTDYTINLNHTHEGMVKLEKYTEATMPQTKDDDIIYVQVDNITTPTEIQALYIFGLEFTGGGAPAIISPSETTINLGENGGSGVSNTIDIKANRYITGDLTVGLAANSDLSFDTTNLPSGVTYNSGAGTLTIGQNAAITGVQITIVYSGSGALSLDEALTISGGGAQTKRMKVVVTFNPYTNFLFDKCVNSSGLSDLQGKCVSPTFELSGTGHFITVRYGYDTGTYGVCGYTSADAFVDTWVASKNLRSFKLGNTVKKVRVTFDSANLDDCFIYDETDDVMLFKGTNVSFEEPYPGVTFGKRLNVQSGVINEPSDDTKCITDIIDLSGSGHTITVKFGDSGTVNKGGLAALDSNGSYVEFFSASADTRTVQLTGNYASVAKLRTTANLGNLGDCFVHDDTDDDYLWKGLSVTENN